MSFTMPAQNTSNITEGSNLYFTNARADARITAADTGDLSEGSNLYFTNARARSAISATGSLSYNSTTGVMSFTMPAQNTSNITEGTNLYYTNARADARIAAASTSDLSEGTNLYYTDARADARVALIVDSSPAALNTLNELAAALGDDANFSTTVNASIALKAPTASPTFTGTVTTPNLTIGSGNKIKFANNDYIRYDDANGVGRFHFDSDGGTNNSSVQAATFVGALSGNATTATTLATARTISLGGDLSGSASFNGSSNITITAIIILNKNSPSRRDVKKPTTPSAGIMNPTPDFTSLAILKLH